jgi:hypothetical protein
MTFVYVCAVLRRPQITKSEVRMNVVRAEKIEHRAGVSCQLPSSPPRARARLERFVVYDLRYTYTYTAARYDALPRRRRRTCAWTNASPRRWLFLIILFRPTCHPTASPVAGGDDARGEAQVAHCVL